MNKYNIYNIILIFFILLSLFLSIFVFKKYSKKNNSMPEQNNSNSTQTPKSINSNNVYIDIYELKNGDFSISERWTKMKNNDKNSDYQFTGYFQSNINGREIHLDRQNMTKPYIIINDPNELSSITTLLTLSLEGDSPSPIGLVKDSKSSDLILTDLKSNSPFGIWRMIKWSKDFVYETVMDLQKNIFTKQILHLDGTDTNNRAIIPMSFKNSNNEYTLLSIDKSQIEQDNDYKCQQPLNSPTGSNLCYKIKTAKKAKGLGVIIRLTDTKYGLYNNIYNVDPYD